ncbi:MAG: hypothetical protein ACREDW_02295, partial [Aestuariivirgaceae bacterium]
MAELLAAVGRLARTKQRIETPTTAASGREVRDPIHIRLASAIPMPAPINNPAVRLFLIYVRLRLPW